eukprot:COSAG02_NODE_857_length_16462_cov_4.801381_9_plen_145_part_00
MRRALGKVLRRRGGEAGAALSAAGARPEGVQSKRGCVEIGNGEGTSLLLVAVGLRGAGVLGRWGRNLREGKCRDARGTRERLGPRLSQDRTSRSAQLQPRKPRWIASERWPHTVGAFLSTRLRRTARAASAVTAGDRLRRENSS